MKAKIDHFLNNWISKKLSVFLIACLGLFLGRITDLEWTNIALMYVGTQGAIDIVKQLRNNGK